MLPIHGYLTRASCWLVAAKQRQGERNSEHEGSVHIRPWNNLHAIVLSADHSENLWDPSKPSWERDRFAQFRSPQYPALIRNNVSTAASSTWKMTIPVQLWVTFRRERGPDSCEIARTPRQTTYLGMLTTRCKFTATLLILNWHKSEVKRFDLQRISIQGFYSRLYSKAKLAS